MKKKYKNGYEVKILNAENKKIKYPKKKNKWNVSQSISN
jgi:hypothetical protein